MHSVNQRAALILCSCTLSFPLWAQKVIGARSANEDVPVRMSHEQRIEAARSQARAECLRSGFPGVETEVRGNKLHYECVGKTRRAPASFEVNESPARSAASAEPQTSERLGSDNQFLTGALRELRQAKEAAAAAARKAAATIGVLPIKEGVSFEEDLDENQPANGEALRKLRTATKETAGAVADRVKQAVGIKLEPVCSEICSPETTGRGTREDSAAALNELLEESESRIDNRASGAIVEALQGQENRSANRREASRVRDKTGALLPPLSRQAAPSPND